MRHLVTLLVALLIIVSLNPGLAQESRTAGEKLSFDILRGMYSRGENALVSPYSLYTALSMAAEGAKGETLAQILSALGTNKAADIAVSAADTANAAFIAADAEVTDGYISRLSAYSAKLFPLNSGDISDINNWAKQVTNGMIDPLLSKPLDENAKLVLINAISMRAKWLTPFNASQTADRIFHAASGEISVPFMRGEMNMAYAEREGLQLGVLPYGDKNLNAYFILPEEGGMERALEKLSREGYEIFKDIANSDVRLSAPKLDIEVDLSLSNPLSENGIHDAFTYDADFSGINGAKDLMIGEVGQKVILKLDEDGTEAAAGTHVSIVPKSIMPTPSLPISFNLDRPFILLIRDEESRQTLFCACVENP